MGIVRVGVILGGNFPDGSCPGWEFALVGVFRWEFSGRNHPGGSFHVTIQGTHSYRKRNPAYPYFFVTPRKKASTVVALLNY